MKKMVGASRANFAAFHRVSNGQGPRKRAGWRREAQNNFSMNTHLFFQTL